MPTSCRAEKSSSDGCERKRVCYCKTRFSHLWYSQAHGNTSEQKHVTVDPVHQFVYTAIGVDVRCSFCVLEPLHSMSTLGVDHHLLNGDKKR